MVVSQSLGSWAINIIIDSMIVIRIMMVMMLCVMVMCMMCSMN